MQAAKIMLPALALLLLPAVAQAQGQDMPFEDYAVTGTLGFDYSNGSYGTDRNTNVLLNLATLGIETGDLKFNVSMPYMRISGRGLVVFDAAGNPVVINRHTTLPPDTRSGFGDLNLSATYTVPSLVLGGFEVKVTGSAKVPTASERKRLSTGEADFGGSIDVSRQFGLWTPFLTVGYLVPGKPKTFTLYNTTSVSAGTSLELSRDWVAVASYDYDSASTPLVPPSHEVFGSLSWLCSDRLTFTGYGTAGLSTGSPNIGFGLLASYGFN